MNSQAEQPRTGGVAPAPWQEPALNGTLPFWASLADDVRAHVHPADWPRSCGGWLWYGLRAALFSTGFHAVFLYRLGHTLRGRLGLAGRVAAALIFWFQRHWHGCSMAATARLYGGLMLPHPQGIVVGAGVVVGPRAWIFQNVTLGGAPGKAGMPRIGVDARIFAGAVVAGPICVGDNVMIGANAVVARDIPDRTLVRVPEPLCVPLPDRCHADRPHDVIGRPVNHLDSAKP